MKKLQWMIIILIQAALLTACSGSRTEPPVTEVPSLTKSAEESGTQDSEESGTQDSEESGTQDSEEGGTQDSEESGTQDSEESGTQDSEESLPFDPYKGEDWAVRHSEDTLVLMTESKIQELNQKNRQTAGTKLADLSQLNTYTVQKVKEMIESYSIPNKAYFRNQEITTEDKTALRKARNLENLSSEGEETEWITPECGILVQNTDLRSFPTDGRLTVEPDGKYDYLQETRLLISEAVHILHTSLDGTYFFIQAENYYGWVPAEAIATCNKSTMLMVYQMESPTIITGNASYMIGESEYYLRMGTKFVSSGEKDGKKQILFPERKEDGSLQLSICTLTTKNEEIQDYLRLGFLPYTRQNLIDLAIRLLDTPYSWGDEVPDTEDNGMDCSSTIAAVFRCFGFVMPRNTGAQQEMRCSRISLESLSLEQKEASVRDTKLGALLYFPGHVMLYLGEENGEQYVLHNTTGEYNRCCITPLRTGLEGNTYADRLTNLLVID